MPNDWCLVHVITTLELGGAQLATLHEVEHCTFGAAPRYLLHGPGGLLDAQAAALDKGRVRAIAIASLAREIDPLRDLRCIADVTAELRRIRACHPEQPMLVHTHSSKAGIVGRIAARLAGAERIVHSIHGFGHPHHGKPWQRHGLWLAEVLVGRLAHGFTADSAANVRQARRENILGNVPAHVVYCGIDVSAYTTPRQQRRDLRRSLGIPSTSPTILNIACLKPQKDPETYVRIAANVLLQHPDATFLLAGDGVLRPSVERLSQELGLGERFKVLGWRRDIPDLLHASDMLMLTSRWEGLPQVFFQAMAVGLPIVATRVDGAPEAIEHGVTGLLYDVGDVEGMVDGTSDLLSDPERRETMGQAGRQRVQRFSQEQMIATLDGFYRELTR